MAFDDFDDPTLAPQGDRVPMKTFLNKLIIVRPTGMRDDMITVHKPNGAEAVFANIALLEPFEGDPYRVFYGVLVMQGNLIGAFKGSIGKNLLGTVYLGPATKGNPPFLFRSLKDNAEAVARGKAWMSDHLQELLTNPSEGAFAEPSAETARAAAAANPWLRDEPPF